MDEPAVIVAVERRNAVAARAEAVSVSLLRGAQRREVALGARSIRGRAAVVNEHADILQLTRTLNFKNKRMEPEPFAGGLLS